MENEGREDTDNQDSARTDEVYVYTSATDSGIDSDSDLDVLALDDENNNNYNSTSNTNDITERTDEKIKTREGEQLTTEEDLKISRRKYLLRHFQGNFYSNSYRRSRNAVISFESLSFNLFLLWPICPLRIRPL